MAGDVKRTENDIAKVMYGVIADINKSIKTPNPENNPYNQYLTPLKKDLAKSFNYLREMEIKHKDLLDGINSSTLNPNEIKKLSEQYDVLCADILNHCEKIRIYKNTLELEYKKNDSPINLYSEKLKSKYNVELYNKKNSFIRNIIDAINPIKRYSAAPSKKDMQQMRATVIEREDFLGSVDDIMMTMKYSLTKDQLKTMFKSYIDKNKVYSTKSELISMLYEHKDDEKFKKIINDEKHYIVNNKAKVKKYKSLSYAQLFKKNDASKDAVELRELIYLKDLKDLKAKLENTIDNGVVDSIDVKIMENLDDIKDLGVLKYAKNIPDYVSRLGYSDDTERGIKDSLQELNKEILSVRVDIDNRSEGCNVAPRVRNRSVIGNIARSVSYLVGRKDVDSAKLNYINEKDIDVNIGLVEKNRNHGVNFKEKILNDKSKINAYATTDWEIDDIQRRINKRKPNIKNGIFSYAATIVRSAWPNFKDNRAISKLKKEIVILDKASLSIENQINKLEIKSNITESFKIDLELFKIDSNKIEFKAKPKSKKTYSLNYFSNKNKSLDINDPKDKFKGILSMDKNLYDSVMKSEKYMFEIYFNFDLDSIKENETKIVELLRSDNLLLDEIYSKVNEDNTKDYTVRIKQCIYNINLLKDRLERVGMDVLESNFPKISSQIKPMNYKINWLNKNIESQKKVISGIKRNSTVMLSDGLGKKSKPNANKKSKNKNK